MNRKPSTGLVDCGHALRNLVLFIVLADVGKRCQNPIESECSCLWKEYQAKVGHWAVWSKWWLSMTADLNSTFSFHVLISRCTVWNSKALKSKVALEKQREKERSIALLKKKEQEVRLATVSIRSDHQSMAQNDFLDLKIRRFYQEAIQTNMTIKCAFYSTLIKTPHRILTQDCLVSNGSWWFLSKVHIKDQQLRAAKQRIQEPLRDPPGKFTESQQMGWQRGTLRVTQHRHS